jgi:sporulation protein YlmC with PRC-barrel domain
MHTKVKLNPGEELKLESSRSKGTMAQTDIYTYSIINQAGEKVGSVEHTDHTSLNGFNRTQHVTQKDNLGNVVVETSW